MPISSSDSGVSRRKTILLVEDEALIAMNEAALLKKNGFEVLTVYNAKTAIEKAAEQSVDLILMDIDLGEGSMDGTEAAEIILNEHELPIVFLTSHAEKEMVEKVKGITRYGYVLKNGGEFVLIEAITMAFELFQAYQEVETAEKHYRKFVEKSNEGIWEIDEEGRTTFVNHQMCEMLGYSQDEMLGQMFNAFVFEHPDSRPLELFEKRRRGISEKHECVLKRKSGGPVYTLMSSVAEMDENGLFYGATAYVLDITDRKLAEESVTKSEEELAAIYEHTPVLMILLDKERRIRKANAFAADFAGSPAEELIGLRGGEALRCIHHLDDPRGCGYGPRCSSCKMREIVLKTFDNNQEYRKTEASLPVLKDSKKENLKFLVSTALIHQRDEDVCLVAIEDITELRRIEQKYRLLAENSGDVIAYFDKDFKPVYISPSAESIFGYSMTDFMNRSIFEIVHPDDRSPLQQKIRNNIEESTSNDSTEFRIYTKSGELKWVEATTKYLYDEEGRFEGIIVHERDITKRKETEKVIAYKNALLTAQQESTIDGIIVVDGDDNIISYNKRFVEMWRLPPEILESGFGEKALDYVRDQVVDPESFVEKIHYLYDHRDEVSKEEIDLKDGRSLSRYSAPLFGPKNRYLGRLWLYRDITDQKRALKEKDYLMKELNHRIKNNLLMISSLINLKDAALGAQADLSDIKHQIDAIRLIHEKLFQTEEITRIDFKSYIQELLSTVFSFSERPVRIDNTIGDVYLETKKAIPLGLIINEIATNAVKHVFTGEESRFIADLKKDTAADQYILTLANTGKPFPEHIDIENPDTLGLRLIAALVEQLNGSLELQRSPHPVFTIIFPCSQ